MVMHPLKHFASAPDGTNDALIRSDIEDQIGSYSENLTSEDKLAFLAVLSRYLYFKQWVVTDYSIGEAIAHTQLEAHSRPQLVGKWLQASSRLARLVDSYVKPPDSGFSITPRCI